MKLRKTTRTLLQLVAPDWMGKLDAVGWNARLLAPNIKNALLSKVAGCFIGEIYCYTNAYANQGNKECMFCRRFCGDIPSILQYGTEPEKKDIMNELAVHLRKEHKQIIKNKKAGKD